ncbi:MAG: type II secretion system protein [Phycisphaerae bacterium]|nr:type II secretion system protein [Phycisphaerae bacterium]
MTLIEVLVCLAVVGVLLALLSGPLAAVREGAKRTRSLQSLASIARGFHAYTQDFAGSWPYFTHVGFGDNVIAGGGLRVEVASFFDAFQTWHIALADGYFSGNASSEALFPPRYAGEGTGVEMRPWFTSYHYPCAFIAHPDFWNPYRRTGPGQWGGTRADQVAFPGSKALVVEGVRGEGAPRSSRGGRRDLARARLVATCDGGARPLPWESLQGGYERGDGFIFKDSGAVHYADSPALLHTTDGVRGRDVR